MLTYTIGKIDSECWEGARSVVVHTTKKVAGHTGYWNADLTVWVPESVTDINKIKTEAYRLAKEFVAEVAASESELYVE